MDENNNVIVRVPEQQIIKGEDGYSPEVTIENINHGHSVTITDRDHPTGQSFNVMDGDSAYEQAVAGGYTGTEAQFNEELASFKELSDEMKEVAPFYAEYGVTTKAEIEAAINNKRQIYLRNEGALGGKVAPYTGTFFYIDTYGEGTGYRFALTEGSYQFVYELKSEWTSNEIDLTAPAQRAEAAAAQALNRMNSADQSAQSAVGSASNASRDAGTASAAATTATTKAGEASNSATAADGSAKDAEAYAVGKRGGADVGSTDPAYHNNAKYYAEQAASSASDAVTAKGAAETAQGKAEDAQEAAEQAQSDAETAAQSVSQSAAQISQNASDISDLKSALTDNIDGTNKGFKELSTGERSVYLYSEYGIKDTGELYEHTGQGFSTYVIFVGGLTSITPSRGQVYAFYNGFPHAGSISYDGSRVVQNVGNVEISIPDGVSFLAVRSDNTVTFNYVNKLISAKNANNETISDLNNITVNTIQRYAANSSNAPDTGEGIAIAFGTQNNTISVIAISASGKVYSRMTWGSSTSEWRILSDINTRLFNSKATIPEYAKDANTLKDNTVSVYTFGWTFSDADMLHFPVTGFSGTILTLGADTITTFKSQIAIYVYGSDTRFYYRAKYANWNDWKQLEETDSDLTPFAGFRKVGVIGDSLASGEAVANNGGTNQFIDNYDYSWIQYIARRDGQTAFNFSSGGLTTRSWLTSANGLTKLQNADNKCQCYIIALGVNDAGTLGYSYIGTIEDINVSDPSQNEDTFYGNYGKIISAIQAIEANAKIFMMTMPTENNEGHRTAVNGAIRSIANSNLFDNCYLIELTDDDVAVPSIANNLRVGHYNAVGYEAISRVIEKKINQYMNTNWSEFRTIEFIGTNYSYTFT